MPDSPDKPRTRHPVREARRASARGENNRPHESPGSPSRKNSQTASNRLTTRFQSQAATSQKLPTFADRFSGGNFFPPGSPLHDWWETNCRYAVEEQARLAAEVLKRVPAESAKPEELLAWFLDIVAGRFDIVARRFLVGIDRSLQFPLYEEFLSQDMESRIAYACSNRHRAGLPESTGTALRFRLMQRKAHWSAEALKQIRDSEQRMKEPDAAQAQQDDCPATTTRQKPPPNAGLAQTEPQANATPSEGLAKTKPISTSEKRAQTIAKIIEELDILKPRIYGQSDYDQLEREYPDFLSFKVAALRKNLQLKLLHIQDHRRHYRLAQELAAAHHGLELSTLQTDWKKHKPKKFRRAKVA